MRNVLTDFTRNISELYQSELAINDAKYERFSSATHRRKNNKLSMDLCSRLSLRVPGGGGGVRGERGRERGMGREREGGRRVGREREGEHMREPGKAT